MKDDFYSIEMLLIRWTSPFPNSVALPTLYALMGLANEENQ